MSRVNTGLSKRDLSAQANEIAELKRHLGVGDQPATMLQGAAEDPNNEDEKGQEGSPAMRYGQIMVAVRKRPKIPNREDEQNDVVRCGDGGSDLTVYAPKVKVDLTPVIEPTHFVFDSVFSERHGNAEVYEKTTRPLLQTVKEGGSAVVFAFGQTGSGKTYTMMGYPGRDPGLYSLAVHDVFEMMGDKVRMAASFYEIYGVKCFDLLNGRNEVRVMQDEYKNVHVVGIVERRVETHDDILELMRAGSELRSSGQTHANDRSSRSHAVLVINLKTKVHGALYGRMTFVDLAGSERASDTTNTDKKTQREGAEINKSLLALKECIRAMGMRKRHIPFRGSKLTQILRESFIGNCSTCVIANVSPCQSHCEDTLNTLRYADRIKELKADGGGADLGESPVPCHNCGDPIFVGDRHVCRRVTAQCQYCRETMDRDRLEEHILQCKEAPAPCPHCFTRVLQGDAARHQKKCLKVPIKCPMCEETVPREGLPRHQKELCAFARVPCRHCKGLFPRGGMDAHEDGCAYAQVVCPHCMMPMKRMRLESHVSSECTSSKGREARGAAAVSAVPQTARVGSPDAADPSTLNPKFQRSPSLPTGVGAGGATPGLIRKNSGIGNGRNRSPSTGAGRGNTNANGNANNAVFQGPHGIAQLARQRHGGISPPPAPSINAPITASSQPLSEPRRPNTMYAGAATDPRLPRLSALERAGGAGGVTNTVPPPGGIGNRRSPSSNVGGGGGTPRGAGRSVSAAGAGINAAGRIGGTSPVRTFAPSPPAGPSRAQQQQQQESMALSPSFNANNLSSSLLGGSGGAVGPLADCPYCKCRLPPNHVDAHVATDCQFAPVGCAFAKYGCRAVMHRLHITKHMAEQMSEHLELVVEYAESMARDNDELRYLLATQTPQGGRSGATTPRGFPITSATSNSEDVAGIIMRSNSFQQQVASSGAASVPSPSAVDSTLAGIIGDAPDVSLNIAAHTLVGPR